MDIDHLISEIKLWMVYEWDEPAHSIRRTILTGLLFNVTQASRGWPRWEAASESLSIILKDYQELPEHIKNIICMFCL